jgi:Uma2 family endonuclease
MSLVTGSDLRRPGVKLTYDDFVLFPDDGKRHELIDGEHYVTPSPNLKHQAVSGILTDIAGSYLRQTRSERS